MRDPVAGSGAKPLCEASVRVQLQDGTAVPGAKVGWSAITPCYDPSIVSDLGTTDGFGVAEVRLGEDVIANCMLVATHEGCAAGYCVPISSSCTITLVPSYDVQLTCRGPGDTPLANVKVALSRTAVTPSEILRLTGLQREVSGFGRSGGLWAGVSGQDGRLTLRSVPAGRYSLRCSHSCMSRVFESDDPRERDHGLEVPSPGAVLRFQELHALCVKFVGPPIVDQDIQTLPGSDPADGRRVLHTDMHPAFLARALERRFQGTMAFVEMPTKAEAANGSGPRMSFELTREGGEIVRWEAAMIPLSKIEGPNEIDISTLQVVRRAKVGASRLCVVDARGTHLDIGPLDCRDASSNGRIREIFGWTPQVLPVGEYRAWSGYGGRLAEALKSIRFEVLEHGPRDVPIVVAGTYRRVELVVRGPLGEVIHTAVASIHDGGKKPLRYNNTGNETRKVWVHTGTHLLTVDAPHFRQLQMQVQVPDDGRTEAIQVLARMAYAD